MREEILFAMKVYRPTTWGQVYENLYFTLDRTVVARTSSKKVGLLFGLVGAGVDGALQQRAENKKQELYRKSSLDDIVKDNWDNYEMHNSEIIAVELKKSYRNIKFNIKPSKKYAHKKRNGLLEIHGRRQGKYTSGCYDQFLKTSLLLKSKLL